MSKKNKPNSKQQANPATMTPVRESQNSPHPVWGGRFTSRPDKLMETINSSVEFDKRLYAQDIAGSIAHCQMLVKQEIVDKKTGAAIIAGLKKIKTEIDENKFNFKSSLEDIHLNIEKRLMELVGDDGGRLHTARSRNDQVSTDFRLWIRKTTEDFDSSIRDLQEALIDKAELNGETVMPGFTHLQAAQPITLGHHFLAYVEMLGRDRGRFKDTVKRLNECPLGAAALAGTSFPIDRMATAKALGFSQPTNNSIDSVSDRDFVLEFLSSAVITAIHLSRLSEEIVLWCSNQFSFAVLSDAFTTGSSVMPQKRNPDAAELVRGKTGRVVGALVALTTILKGLPLAYSKDLQEDKEPVFDAADSLSISIFAMTAMIKDLKFDSAKLKEAAGVGHTTATDLADWLVRVLGLPFRQAHQITGTLVKLAEGKERTLSELSLAEMQSVEPGINKDVYSVLGVLESVTSKTSYGGTTPQNVLTQAQNARKRFL